MCSRFTRRDGFEMNEAGVGRKRPADAFIWSIGTGAADNYDFIPRLAHRP